MLARALVATVLIGAASAALAAETNWPNYQETDFIIKNYAFKSGESLPEARIHYRTLGTPKRDGSGNIVNAVLLLQGNTGTSALCFLLGTTTPLSTAQLAALYPLHSDYVAAVARSAASDVREGFLLPADALQIDQDAAGSVTGLPAPTG